MKPVAKSFLGLIVGLASLVAAAPVAGSPAQKHNKHEQPVIDRPAAVAVAITFSPRETQVIREYYAPRYRNLPPGLQKKMRRTGQLPAGWQKKLEPFPVAIERELVVLPAGYHRGVIDGRAVIVDSRTHAIVDLVVLF